MAIFKGSGVAIITPFNENKEVDFDKLGELIEFHIDNGTDSIIICGTTGEASTLTHEEHIECIRYTVDKVNKRIPVIAGTGSNCTDTAIYLSKKAQAAGSDGLLVVTPYYNKATQKGLVAHYAEIGKSVDIPILMYNVPGRTGCNLAAKTIATIVKEVDNVVGVKEASGNIGHVAEIMHLTQGDIDLYSGNDDQIVPLLSLGGIGVISVLANIAPRQTHDMVMTYLEGDINTSRDLQLKYLSVINALFCEVNPIPVKAAMNLMGMKVGGLRMPLTEIEAHNEEHLRNELLKVGLITL
ncbi:MAG: 4-hydroxy-tetrahydrodipicolinate synthase [Clostridiales bacterium]|jgi:4-hydroxy-tetrahydrodipicolinate synthase|nr:4-hydroxy-tetrahydrodipicolinate synthase [Clostridiales bacterium]